MLGIKFTTTICQEKQISGTISCFWEKKALKFPNMNLEAKRRSEILLEREKEQVRISRHILIAILREKPLKPEDLGKALGKAGSILRQRNPEYFLDLGWQEDIHTALQSLQNLNLVFSANPHDFYCSTELGLSHLQQTDEVVKEKFGLSWEEIAKLILEKEASKEIT